MSDLLDPSEPRASLDVAPGSVVDSAVVGEETVLRLSLTVRAEGRAPLSWSVAKARGAAWLATDTEAGTTPGAVEVALAPAELTPGAHHDTLIFTAVSFPAPAVRVPIELRLREPEPAACPTYTLTSTSERTGRLDADACESLLGGDRRAIRYRFQAGGGDTLSATVTTGDFDPYVLVAEGSEPHPVLAQSESCAHAGADACLPYVRFASPGEYLLEVVGSASSTGAFTVGLAPPRAPDAPGALDQRDPDGALVARGDTTVGPTVVLEASLSDPDTWDPLRLELEVRTAGSAFLGQRTHAADGGHGETPSVTVDGLTPGEGYRWQARTVDGTGRATGWVAFGGGAGPDFVVGGDQPPTAVTGLRQTDGDGGSLPVGGTASTDAVVLFGTLHDPEGRGGLRLEVEARRLGEGLTGEATHGGESVASGAEGSVRVGGLPDDGELHWQARAVDAGGQRGPWTAFGDNGAERDFAVDFEPDEPGPPQQLGQFRSDGVTPIALGGTTDETTVVLRATLTDTDPDASVRLEVEVIPVALLTLEPVRSASSAPVASGQAAQVAVSGLVRGSDYRWRARAVDESGSAGPWIEFGGNVDSDPDFRVRGIG